MPRVLANPYPFEIVQAPPGQVTILYELSHQVRPIRLDKPLQEEEISIFPAHNGHSAGHYEGDTLVVETAGFNERTFIDATGAPHTDELRTFERIRKVSPTELEDVVTIHDPAILFAGLAGTLRLHAAQRRADRRLCLRRAAPRSLLGQGSAATVSACRKRMSRAANIKVL